MSRAGYRLIATLDNVEQQVSTKVLWDIDWCEYQVYLYSAGNLLSNATYHTENKEDAISTAIFLAGLAKIEVPLPAMRAVA